MALSRVWIPSPNYSSRGAAIRLAVVHTAEGSRTYQDLGAYFANPNMPEPVSSHVGIDDTPGVVGEYVHAQPGVAWTQAAANGYSVSAELCAFAAWTDAEWAQHPAMLDNCAAWIAEECARFGIPRVRLSAAQAQGGAAGVCGHVDLGAAGGGHSDPGSSFPWPRVMGGPAPAPAPEQEDDNMILGDGVTGGVWVAQRDGAVYAYDGAPYAGGANNKTMNAGGYPCVGIGAYGDGYLLVLDFGTASGGDRYRRYRFPRDGSGIQR